MLQPTKRKADEINEIDSEDDRLQYITDNCDQVRRKIRTFLNSGEMKVTEFQRVLGVNSNAYGRFMGYTGKDKGSASNTYVEAYKFFKKRELQGIKVPKKKAKTAEEDAKSDVSAITLEGEATNEVLVFDTCDEVRKKIRAYLAQPGVTQAAFLREIAKTYGDGRKIQSKVLNDFLGKRGASAGNTSSVFYSSYVFFEKLRIKDGKPKSKHRQEMEKQYAGEGFDTKSRNDRGFYCFVGETPVEDKYGKIHFLKG